jgi:hypothetical protein
MVMEMMSMKLRHVKGRLVRFCILVPTILILTLFVVSCKNEVGPNDSSPTGNITTPNNEPIEVVETSPITGLPLEEVGSVCAVSIGNNPSARPQSGLNDADLVYEVLAEGGITRYLAIFHSEASSKIGPVRSARPYLALLAKEWGAVFAHCGGDPKDLEPIREWQIVDADEFKHSSLYWRDSSRKAPDNLYTNVDNLREIQSSDLTEPSQMYDFGEWTDTPEDGLKIVYNNNYAVQYVYNDHKYLRYVIEKGKAKEHCDLDTDKPIEVSNIIVQFADHKVVYSDLGLAITLIGEGPAMYLLGGSYQEGAWKKESVDDPTIFYTAEGKRITLAPGQTWIQIVPTDTSVTITSKK